MTRRFRSRTACLVIVALFMVAAVFGDQKRTGAKVFQNRCGGCHSPDRDGVGPRLRGVFGRAAGSVQTFQYSDALKSSRLVWDGPTLDKWLQDPDSVVADNEMSFRLDNQEERTAIVEYLKGLTAD